MSGIVGVPDALPADWSVTSLRYVISEFGGGATPQANDGAAWCNAPEGIPFVTISDMSGKREVYSAERHITEMGRQASGLRVRPVGTLLYSMYATLGHAAALRIEACHNQAILALFPDHAVIDAGFLLYWFEHLRPSINASARSNTQENLSARVVGALPVMVPSLEVQRRVVHFLESETARIDSLIAKKDELAQLVERKRFEIIARAVALGLDGAPTRQSGLGWSKGVAVHYRVGSYALYSKTGSGHTPSRSVPDYWIDCDIPWVTTSDVSRLRLGRLEYLDDTTHKISRLGLANSAATLHPEDTVFLSRTASVGFAGIMGHPMATSQDFFTWTCGPDLVPEYLLWSLRAMGWRGEFERLQYGSTHKTIYVPDLMALRGPVPPVGEQHEIVRYIRARLEPMFELVGRVRDEQRLLRERRQALVTAAVTGQIEV